jgi:hypothetical protein
MKRTYTHKGFIMKTQIIGRFTNPNEVVKALTTHIQTANTLDYTIGTTDNGAVYVESNDENILHQVYQFRLLLETA